MSEERMTHLNSRGHARMVDVGNKTDTDRTAIASARVLISSELLSLIKEDALKKGDALSTARIAGIQAAKRTHELIPLCHPLPITHVALDMDLVEDPPSVEITAEVRTHYRTGIEMEALTAASVAALTIYDMGKSVDRGIVIEHVRLERKDGGKSGEWKRAE